MVLEVGGVAFHLYHDRGETDDGTWVYLPQYRGAAHTQQPKWRAHAV
jgi:hypothetical protein